MLILICKMIMKGCDIMINFNSPLKLDDCTLHFAEKNSSSLPEFSNESVYKIICVTFGSITVSKNNTDFTVSVDNGILILPYENVTFQLTNDAKYNIIDFSVDSGKYRESFSNPELASISLDGRIFKNENISNTVNKLCKELEAGENIFSRELVSLLGSELAVYILRHFGTSFKKNESDNANIKLCGHVMEYIDSRIYTMKSLREVASAMGYNYSYVSTLFHKTTGVTLNNYFKQKRMNEAKNLLSNNKMSISEIARIMNYSSVYAFSKAFKEHFGSSPGHYSGRFVGKDN